MGEVREDVLPSLEDVEAAVRVGHMKYLVPSGQINSNGWKLCGPERGILVLFNSKTKDFRLVNEADQIIESLIRGLGTPKYNELRLVEKEAS